MEEGLDRFARIGADWIATCLVGGGVAIAAGMLVPEGNEPLRWLLVGLGVIAVVVGVVGIAGEIVAWRRREPSEPTVDATVAPSATASGTRNITVAGSNNTITVSEAAAQRLTDSTDDPLAPLAAVDDALAIADSAFADPATFDRDPHWHRAEHGRLAMSARALIRQGHPTFIPDLDAALTRDPADGQHESQQLRGTLVRVRGVLHRITNGELPSTAPTQSARPSTASGSGQAFDATVSITDSVEARVTPGPGSPTLDQASYETSGRRHFAYGGLGRRPKAIRFTKPEDRILRSADLPFVMASGKGRLVVEKFYSDGVVIDEDGTSGDPVAFLTYFDDEPVDPSTNPGAPPAPSPGNPQTSPMDEGLVVMPKPSDIPHVSVEVEVWLEAAGTTEVNVTVRNVGPGPAIRVAVNHHRFVDDHRWWSSPVFDLAPGAERVFAKAVVANSGDGQRLRRITDGLPFPVTAAVYRDIFGNRYRWVSTAGGSEPEFCPVGAEKTPPWADWTD